ncbi:LCP family protein [Actinoplanes sp. G11-F43]|uniref:LCP family protein n=1 Tax=Actinoplanes sp. G11-F43 TaxID=3424130 RepID=UPI003D34D38D
MTRSGKRLWARLGIAVGSLLLVPAVGALAVLPPPSVPAIDPHGPVNFLLVGIDPRGTHTKPLADTIMIAHIPSNRRGVYLFSLPRDLVVGIHAYPRSGSPAQRTKINAAMALGSRVGPDKYDVAQGFDLLSRTVGSVTGIRKFDAGAVLNFEGFRKLVSVLGGVTMVIDQDVVSEHLKPDGRPRDRRPGCQGHHKCLRPYVGVQKTYRKSRVPVRLRGWEALDYVRQRYGLPRVDYDRQRHQRQLVKALAGQVARDVVADPAKLPAVIGALGDSLTFIGGAHGALAWAGAVRDLRLSTPVSVTLPGRALFDDGRYLGEQLDPGAREFFAAVNGDRVSRYVTDHPSMVD